jgi:hypothetical protein
MFPPPNALQLQHVPGFIDVLAAPLFLPLFVCGLILWCLDLLRVTNLSLSDLRQRFSSTLFRGYPCIFYKEGASDKVFMACGTWLCYVVSALLRL